MRQTVRKIKRIKGFLWLLLLLTICTGCSLIGSRTSGELTGETAANTKQIEYEEGRQATGGVSTADANLKLVSMQEEGDDLVISLSFLHGSKFMDVNEAVLDHVPLFKAAETKAPYRIEIQLEGVAFWDWEKVMPDFAKNRACARLVSCASFGNESLYVLHSIIKESDFFGRGKRRRSANHASSPKYVS